MIRSRIKIGIMVCLIAVPICSVILYRASWSCRHLVHQTLGRPQSWRVYRFMRQTFGPPPYYEQARTYLKSQPLRPSDLSVPPETFDYRFSVVGHIVAPFDPSYPFIKSFPPMLPAINRDSEALILLGDVKLSYLTANWDVFDSEIRDRISIPLFLATGNHDLDIMQDFESSIQWYKERYGPTYFDKKIKRTQLIILSTEYDRGDFKGDQLDFLVQSLQQALNDETVDHVMLFMHRVAWFFGHPRYKHVIPLANLTTMRYPNDVDRQVRMVRSFWTDVFPLLRKIAEKKAVYLFAGDVGKNVPIIYDEMDNVHLVATGCRGYLPENTWNHFVEVFVCGKNIQLHVVPLEGEQLARVEHYDLAFWGKLNLRR